MGKDLSSALRPALVLTLLFALLLGFAYPLAITGVGQLLFPSQANGSLIERDGKVIGSDLIGQPFTQAGYFRPRPSAAGKGYDGKSSSGSNLGPTSQALIDRVKTDVGTLRGEGVEGAIEQPLIGFLGEPRVNVLALNLQLDRLARERR